MGLTVLSIILRKKMKAFEVSSFLLTFAICSAIEIDSRTKYVYLCVDGWKFVVVVFLRIDGFV